MSERRATEVRASSIIKSVPLFLVFVCAWKIVSEFFLVVTGSPPRGVIERFVNYATPPVLALC
jgi:hypothetical protein